MADSTLRAPLYITMHECDNVAIVANDGGLPAGTTFPSGLTLVDKVFQTGKKVPTHVIENEDQRLGPRKALVHGGPGRGDPSGDQHGHDLGRFRHVDPIHQFQRNPRSSSFPARKPLTR